MPPSLDALHALSALSDGPSRTNLADPNGYVQSALRRKKLIDELTRNQELAASNPLHSVAGATNSDIASLKDDTAEDPQTGTAATDLANEQQKTYQQGVAYEQPEALKMRNEEQARKLALTEAPARVAAEGNLAVTKAETEGKIKQMGAQNDATTKLLETLTGGHGGGGPHSGGIAGPGGSIKPTVNASGGVSFTTTPMPALVQRARNQLMDARDKTLSALDAAEKQYAGINDEATKTDQSAQAPGWGAFLMGSGQKFGGASDMAAARNDRLKYDIGLPTPFSELAQTASFGNIEQMAGQLPGVRGLATITPLFKEHQSRWGHETPLATVQRLRHMAKLMDETLTTLDTSGAGPEQ